MKNIKLILTVTVFALFMGCANDDNYNTPYLDGNCEELTSNVEVSSVFAAATNTMQQYVTDDIIEAYVASSDEGGNFYKSISFVSLDNERGFSMPVDDYNLYTKFPPGKKVYIKLDSLHIQNRTSQTRGLQIGAAYQGNVGRIAPILYRDIIIPACEGSVNEDEIVNNLTIQQAKNDAHLNKLIEFEGVQFTDASLGHNYFDASMNPFPTWTATNHNIEDINGNTIIVRISQFSTFAMNPVAEGSGKIRGVLTKYGNDYQFMVLTELDIKLTDDRLGEPEPEEPEEPGENSAWVFPGGDFEDWDAFTGHLNNFGIKPYATQSTGNGRDGSASLHINTTGAGGNDYVFTSLAHEDLPANPTKIRFWIKGTASKTVSINVYKEGTGYFVFNLGDVTTTKTLTVSPSNQYIGTINTGGEWVQITLDLNSVDGALNLTDFTKDFFALKVGSAQPYDLHFDEFTIE